MSVEISDQERMSRAITSVRNFIRDKKVLNRLLMGQHETSDDEMRQAIIMALINWNNTPPILGAVDLNTHPRKDLLIKGAAIEALIGAGLWHSREHMPSSDGGTSGDDHAKAGEYSGWIERLTQQYDKEKSDTKTAINIANSLGQMGVRSEYSWRIYGLQGEEW